MIASTQQALVTGATGFIGSALAEGLARRGYAVRALVRKENIQKPAAVALNKAGVTLMPGDLRDNEAVAQAVRGCSHIYHLAAQKTARGIPLSQYLDVNVHATRQLAELALAAGVQRFVHASTLGVHGFVVRGAINEQSPTRPNTDYRRSKLLGEGVLRDLHRDHALPLVIARVSTIVGAGARSWYPLIRVIADGRMRLIGNGANYIDLVTVDDIVDGLHQCATVAGIEGRTYVLGSASPMTFREFADAIAKAAGVSPAGNGPPAAPYRAVWQLLALLYRATGIQFNGAHHREVLIASKAASSALAHAELGYAPSHSLTDAINAMVAGYAVLNGQGTGRT